MHGSELMLVAQMVLGFVWQLARALKNVSNWLSYAIFAAAAALAYIFATPDFGSTFHTSWRFAIAGMISFVLAARGAASGSSDAKVAPKTNTL